VSTIERSSTVDLVEVAPIRDAFLRSGLTLSDVAWNAGWMRLHRGKVWADASRVGRCLGLKAQSSRAGERRFVKRVHYEVAVALVRAIGYDPVDFREIGI
jgi:hypothetical protein